MKRCDCIFSQHKKGGGLFDKINWAFCVFCITFQSLWSRRERGCLFLDFPNLMLEHVYLSLSSPFLTWLTNPAFYVVQHNSLPSLGARALEEEEKGGGLLSPLEVLPRANQDRERKKDRARRLRPCKAVGAAAAAAAAGEELFYKRPALTCLGLLYHASHTRWTRGGRGRRKKKAPNAPKEESLSICSFALGVEEREEFQFH